MKKVFYVLCGFLILSSSGNFNKILAENSQDKASEANAEEVKITKHDLADFPDLNSIFQSEYVQDNVKYLQAKVLELLKIIGRSNPDSKDSETIKGTSSDIDDAARRVNYLVSLETNVEQADSLERVRNILKLNEKGKEKVKEAIDIIQSSRDADSFKKLKALTFMNKNIPVLIDKYTNLENKVVAATSLDKLQDIPGIPKEIVKESNTLKATLNSVKKLVSVEQAVNSPVLNSTLKGEISNLINLEAKLKESKTVAQLKQIPTVPQVILKYIDNLEIKTKKQKENIAKLTTEKENAFKQVEVTEINAEKTRRFTSVLVGTILRALIGFDSRNSKYDFAKSKELKITDKTALIAASKNSFSHLGGTEEDLYKIVNTLQEILKLVLSDKNWMNHVDSIKKKLEAVNTLSKKFNEDANIIKRNVDFALQVVDHIIQRKDRPPKDTVETFEEIVAQTLQQSKEVKK